jgi:hypothetical protein
MKEKESERQGREGGFKKAGDNPDSDDVAIVCYCCSCVMVGCCRS